MKKSEEQGQPVLAIAHRILEKEDGESTTIFLTNLRDSSISDIASVKLAAAVGSQSKKVLLVEVGSQNNLSVLVNAKVPDGVKNSNIVDIVKTKYHNVNFTNLNSEFEDIDEVLGQTRSQYDVTFVYCPYSVNNASDKWMVRTKKTIIFIQSGRDSRQNFDNLQKKAFSVDNEIIGTIYLDSVNR